jgi:hypothetical protein
VDISEIFGLHYLELFQNHMEIWVYLFSFVDICEIFSLHYLELFQITWKVGIFVIFFCVHIRIIILHCLKLFRHHVGKWGYLFSLVPIFVFLVCII